MEQQQRSPPRAGPVSPSAQSDGTSSTQQLESRFSRMAMEERSATVTRIGNNGKP